LSARTSVAAADLAASRGDLTVAALPVQRLLLAAPESWPLAEACMGRQAVRHPCDSRTAD